jgi:hypothetical protein
MEKCSRRKIYSGTLLSLLILMVFIGVNAVTVKPVQSENNPTLYVDPPTYNAHHIGEVFQINVKIADVQSDVHLIGAEFKLQYNETLLTTEENWTTEGNFFNSVGTTYFMAVIETDANAQKYIHAFVILLPSENATYSTFPSGSGTIATITFNATYRPIGQSEGTSALTLFDTILVDENTNTVSHTAVSGQYNVPSLAVPTVEVSPSTYTALRVGETFNVSVNIGDVDPDWRLVGLQFKLSYNTTLLETRPEWISEGGFFSGHGATWFQAIVEEDYGVVGVLLLPNATGGWSGPFPDGDGTIATITFRSIYQPVEPLTGSSVLALTDTILVNDQGQRVPNNVSNGEFAIVAAEAGIDLHRPLDVQIDVGSLHFNGEIADFYVLVMDYGRLVSPDNMTAVLYFGGSMFSDVTSSLYQLANGLYRIPFTVPSSAQSGSYVLMVHANYLQTSGSAIKSFLVSSTLSGWNSAISNIQATVVNISGQVATVVVPSIGQMRVDLQAVNATLTSIDGDVATIGTNLGNLTTDVMNLNVTLVSIDGNVATLQTNLGTLQGTVQSIQGDTVTIKTDVGTLQTDINNLKTDVSDVQGSAQTSMTLIYVTLSLALIAMVAAVAAVFVVQRKRP